MTRHRRVVAAVLVAVAAGVTVDAVALQPPPGLPVVTAASDLAAGAVVGPGDLTVVEAPAALVPAGALGVDDVHGRRLAGPLRHGEVVTDADLLGPGLLAGQPAGTVAVPVRTSQPPTAGLLRPGDRVQVLAGPAPSTLDGLGAPGQAEVVAASVTVLTVPADGGGLLGGESAAQLLVAATPAEALDLATASDGRWLSVAVLP